MFRAGDAGRDIHVKRHDGKQARTHPVEERLRGEDESYRRTEAGGREKVAGAAGGEADFGRSESGDGIQEESFVGKEAG